MQRWRGPKNKIVRWKGEQEVNGEPDRTDGAACIATAKGGTGMNIIFAQNVHGRNTEQARRCLQ